MKSNFITINPGPSSNFSLENPIKSLVIYNFSFNNGYLLIIMLRHLQPMKDIEVLFENANKFIYLIL